MLDDANHADIARHREASVTFRIGCRALELDTVKQQNISQVVKHFDTLPESALLDIGSSILIARRSRASFYRHFKAGELTLIKVGNSTRIRVGELRHLIGLTEGGQS